jgi:hypothetical protein
MELNEQWRKGRGEGAKMTIPQLLAHADSEYKRLVQLGQWTTKNKASNLLGLQASLNTLKSQFTALLSWCTKLKNKQQQQQQQQQQSNQPTGEPKEDEHEERTVNGVQWYYCTKCHPGNRWNCWNKTHKSEQHQKGVGKNKNNKDKEDIDETTNMATYDAGFGAVF